MRKKFTKKMVAFSLAATVIATGTTPVSVSAQKLTSPTDYSNPENWNVRHTVKDIYGMLTELEKAYPEYAELGSIGKTTKENDIKLLTITNENSKNKNKKGVAYLANIHGDERESGESAAYTAAWLLENLDDPMVKEMLERNIIYIIPILNPDSHDIFEYFVRGTSQLLDKNGDGIPSNDLYADITGDEWIGYPYTTDESKTRTGDIGYESKDLDGNGWLGDDSWASGYDINRNFDFQWAPEHAGTSGGLSAASEIETQHIQNFLKETPLDALVTVHTGIQAVLYPWGYRDTDQSNPEEVADIEFMANTAEKMRKAIEQTTERNYYVSNSYHDYQTYSELLDYAYGVHGIHTYTMEVICEGYDESVSYKPDRNPDAYENPENFDICLWNDPKWEGSRKEYIPYEDFVEIMEKNGLSPETVKVVDRTTKEEKTLSEMKPAYIYVSSSERNQRGTYVAEDQDKLVEGAKNAFLEMVSAENGEKVVGWKAIDGKWYYFNEYGVMETGWVSVDGHWYYLNEDGIMENGWVFVDGHWYYMDQWGAMETGWVFADGHWYYMDQWGAMRTGWVSVDGHWYYMDQWGAMRTGWVSVGDYWYYMDQWGAMQTGWVFVDAYWYYLNSDGSMAASQWIGDYYVQADGAMATNTWIDRYYVDASGRWVKNA